MLADSYSYIDGAAGEILCAQKRADVIGGYLSLLVGAQLPVDANSPISIREFCEVMVQSEA